MGGKSTFMGSLIEPISDEQRRAIERRPDQNKDRQSEEKKNGPSDWTLSFPLVWCRVYRSASGLGQGDIQRQINRLMDSRR